MHSGSRGFTPARVPLVGFIMVRFGSLGHSNWSSGSFGFASVLSSAYRGFRIHSAEREFTLASLVFARFIMVRVCSFVRPSGSFGFAWVHSSARKCLRDHSRSREFILGVVSFSRGSLGRS